MRALASMLALAVAAGGCTRSTAPKARLAGEVLSISGVVGLVGGALLTRYSPGSTGEVMGTFSLVSASGIALYIVGEQTDPAGPEPESPEHMHRRWAKILTERASGAAREGNCPRVRRLEKRVHVYNQEVHDFVFMRDPEILRCLEAPVPAVEPAAEPPTVPEGLDPGPVHPEPTAPDPAPSAPVQP